MNKKLERILFGTFYGGLIALVFWMAPNYGALAVIISFIITFSITYFLFPIYAKGVEIRRKTLVKGKKLSTGEYSLFMAIFIGIGYLMGSIGSLLGFGLLGYALGGVLGALIGEKVIRWKKRNEK